MIRKGDGGYYEGIIFMYDMVHCKVNSYSVAAVNFLNQRYE